MSLKISTRERVWAWLLASGIAGLAVGVFATAIVLGGPSRSDAAVVRPEVPLFEPKPLPREWRWQRKPITFDHMFRQMRDTEPESRLR